MSTVAKSKRARRCVKTSDVETARQTSPERKLSTCLQVLKKKEDLIQRTPLVTLAEKRKLSLEINMLDVLEGLLNDEIELRSLKKTLDTEEPSPSEELREPRAKRQRASDYGVVSELLKSLDEMLESTRSVQNCQSEELLKLKQRNKEVAIELADCKKRLAEKHKELTDYARSNCTSPAQQMPVEVLRMIFSLVPIADLVTVGQVCQLWRTLSRSDESLWSGRKLQVNAVSKHISRILYSAPLLGDVAVGGSRKVVNMVTDARCKILGFTLGCGGSYLMIHEMFEKHSKNLKSITTSLLTNSLAKEFASLKITTLTLQSNNAWSGDIKFPVVEISTLLTLNVCRRLSTCTLFSVLKQNASTLKTILLKSPFCLPDSKIDRKNLAVLLSNCSNLVELQVPYCKTKFDLSKLSSTLKCLTVSMDDYPLICNHMDHTKQGNVPETCKYILPTNSIDLKFLYGRGTSSLTEVFKFLKNQTPAFLSNLKSVSFQSKCQLTPQITLLFKSMLKDIPALNENKCKLLHCK